MHGSAIVRRLVAVAAAGLLAGLPAAAPGYAAPSDAGTADAAVTKKLLKRAEGMKAFANADAQDTKVEVTRSEGRWAFGVAVLLAPHVEDAYPEGWLFLAKRDNAQWHVAFEGESDFAELSDSSPIVSDEERKTFASHGGVSAQYYNGDYRTVMRLPWSTGQSWYMTGGPHGWGGTAAPWSSADFSGGDQVVRATRSGTAYTMCRGWIRVIHGGGYSTDYYHLWSNINVNGAAVGAGAYLGYTGTDVTCGGAASGRHVHLGLRQSGNYVPLHGHVLGKWVIMNGGSAYQGSALHGSRRVYAGGALYNYGALGWTQGIVDANGGNGLNKRSGPGTGYSIVGSVADGATVSISCSRNGTSHTGRWGTTSLWNRLTDGSWISDAYLYTGSAGPVSGWC